MMFVNGFLFTLGGLTAFAFTIFVLAVYAKSKKKPIKATVKDWRGYLIELTRSNQFEEAGFIAKLTNGKAETDEIDTPKGYKVDVHKEIVIDDNCNEGLSKIKILKTFKIKRLA